MKKLNCCQTKADASEIGSLTASASFAFGTGVRVQLIDNHFINEDIKNGSDMIMRFGNLMSSFGGYKLLIE